MSRQEPDWDERSRLVLWAYMDYEADLHTCGRPLSESLFVAGAPRPQYDVLERTCLACQRLEEHAQNKHKDGVPPHLLLQVATRAESLALMKAQQQKG